MRPARRQRTPKEELRINKVILCDFAESVAADAMLSADLAGDVDVEVTSPADFTGKAIVGVDPGRPCWRCYRWCDVPGRC